MAEARIPVDVFNPGQVFACLGLMEMAEALLGNAEAAFVWPEDRSSCDFILRAAGEEHPLHATINFFQEAEIYILLPVNFSGRIKKRYANTCIYTLKYPLHESDKFSIAPIILKKDSVEVLISYWDGKDSYKMVEEVKFWAGNYSAADVIYKYLEYIRKYDPAWNKHPFDYHAPISSSFRLDWRRDYVPLDIGFSLNQHDDVVAVGYPLTEILASIGLNYARPKKLEQFRYQYAIISTIGTESLLPPVLVRAALGGADLPFPKRQFQMQLGEPGQHQRCITNVIEES